MIITYAIAAIIIGAAIYTVFRTIGTPKSNSNARTQAIEAKISSLGGSVEKIETSKSDNYPYIHELNRDDGSYHVFYKITYRLGEEIKEGWAVLKLEQSMVGPNGATDQHWIWKL